MSDSVWPHTQQPIRLPHPWDSPGKNTGVGFHFLLQCMKVKSESEVAQSYPTLHNPMDCSLPGSPTHWIFQARVLIATIFLKFLISIIQTLSNIYLYYMTYNDSHNWQPKGRIAICKFLEPLKTYFLISCFLRSETQKANINTTTTWQDKVQ